MRKVWILLGLSLLLLLTQQGAVLHELGHICHIGTQDVSVHAASDSLSERTCELCLAFSQLAHPASHTIHVPLLVPVAAIIGAGTHCSITPAELPTVRSRGPPAATLNS
jgi:hypothetical protein